MRRSMTRPLGGRTPALVLAGAVLAALLAASPAAADWLVTRGHGSAAGARVETRGPWQVKGRLVVFETAAGQLASLRLDDVDLEASREATREAEEGARAPAAEPAAQAPPEPPPRRRITDSDIAPGRYAAAPETEGEGDGETADAAPDGPAADTLVVISSREEETPDGHARITGTLANHGEQPAAGVALTVELFDAAGRAARLGGGRARRAGADGGRHHLLRRRFP